MTFLSYKSEEERFAPAVIGDTEYEERARAGDVPGLHKKNLTSVWTM